MSDIYQSLSPLIEKKALVKDPGKFHSLVNVIFHDYEANNYDELHREMWESLPQQYELLINDIKPHIAGRSGLKLLDIGCGTGLATELLLKTTLVNKISEIHLLDTSQRMLELALKRSSAWHKQVRTINGDIAAVNDQYDVIIISSVLHHIPDLADFLQHINRIQKPGSILITIHDPFAGSLESDVYIKRTKEYDASRLNSKRNNGIPLGERIVNKLKRIFRVPTYMERINQKLLHENIISEPLNEPELWSITDIHVEGLPYSIGKGISKELLTNYLPNYTLLSFRTYAFFGLLYSNLDNAYKKKETELSLQKDMHGRNFCSAWIKVAE
jgi:ubiquinone/menaquinone biosynthesis C-methylase UbiE